MKFLQNLQLLRAVLLLLVVSAAFFLHLGSSALPHHSQLHSKDDTARPLSLLVENRMWIGKFFGQTCSSSSPHSAAAPRFSLFVGSNADLPLPTCRFLCIKSSVKNQILDLKMDVELNQIKIYISIFKLLDQNISV